jgi:hypothetical protein
MTAIHALSGFLCSADRRKLSKEGRGEVELEKRIGYRREPHAGDLITIRSRVLEVNEKTARMSMR